MGVSGVAEVVGNVSISFSITIPAQTQETVEIDIERYDWQHGLLQLYEDVTRKTFFGVVTRLKEKVVDQSTVLYAKLMSFQYCGYIVDNWLYSGFSYAIDSQLTDNNFAGTGNPYARIDEAYIAGKILYIKVYNYSSSVAETLTMRGLVSLSRKVLQ